MRNKIALSTSLSYKQEWDPLYSLEITERLGVKHIQIYLGENILSSHTIIEEIKAYSKNISFIIHSPVDLNDSALEPLLINKIKEFKESTVSVVYHHDVTLSVARTLEIISVLNREGIVVLLEDFYPSVECIKWDINHYKAILQEAKAMGLKLFPLLDIPRLYKGDIANAYCSDSMNRDLLDAIKELELPLYLHLIDVNEASQGRSQWCSLGSGIIPYKTIFDYIRVLDLDIPLVVLEFEEEKHIEASIDYLVNVNFQ